MSGRLERTGHLLAGAAFAGLLFLCALVTVVVLRALGPLAVTSRPHQLALASALAGIALLALGAAVLRTPQRRPFRRWFWVGGLLGLAASALPMFAAPP